ncbi:TFIIH subunit Tfb4/p34 [Syncephalis fuscata]|nr:TFIIH subunit Tfb4/p34 [Syncephalis fuscata]
MTALTNEEPSLLAVIIDTNPLGWSRLGHGDGQKNSNGNSSGDSGVAMFTKALRQILVFLNSFVALDTRNRLLVLAAHPGHSSVLYDSNAPSTSAAATTATATTNEPVTDIVMMEVDGENKDQQQDRIYPQFNEMNQQIWSHMQKLFTESETTEFASNNGPSIAGALSMVLCYTNRVLKDHAAIRWQPRALIISASEDVPSQYTPLMNCIFSAQRSSVSVDVCKIHRGRGVFLRQAAHITGGLHFTIQRPNALLQYLLSAFLPDVKLRESLCLPNREEVDFRAACFCHRRIINIGYVCSVCLSIFCDTMDICTTCRTPFSTKPIITSQHGVASDKVT